MVDNRVMLALCRPCLSGTETGWQTEKIDPRSVQCKSIRSDRHSAVSASNKGDSSDCIYGCIFCKWQAFCHTPTQPDNMTR